MQPLVYRTGDWEKVWAQVVKDHGPKITISWVTKRKLGFTVREHRDYSEQRGFTITFRLDFDEEKYKSLFLLKYGDIASPVKVQRRVPLNV